MLVYILWVSLSLGLLDLAAVDQQRPPGARGQSGRSPTAANKSRR
jgi:hypothetical protein